MSKAKPLSRRQLISQTGVAVTAAFSMAAVEPRPTVPTLNVLVIGGHPGDPEAGCGGTIARYTAQGHAVTMLYLTRGEAGVQGKNAAQAAAIRSAEAEQACNILKGRPLFAAQIDGATEITAPRYGEFTNLVAGVNPDIVFTQWPVDTHRDHRICSILTLDAFLTLKRKFALYYYEVDLGSDTQCFRPTDYVDVTSTEKLKRDACMAHQSQNPDGFYTKDHEPMLRFRGMEAGCKAAEAFIHYDQSPTGHLPGR
jgi:LmbE family N-acetylglucosaminyl deacetylase